MVKVHLIQYAILLAATEMAEAADKAVVSLEAAVASLEAAVASLDRQLDKRPARCLLHETPS